MPMSWTWWLRLSGSRHHHSSCRAERAWRARDRGTTGVVLTGPVVAPPRRGEARRRRRTSHHYLGSSTYAQCLLSVPPVHAQRRHASDDLRAGGAVPVSDLARYPASELLPGRDAMITTYVADRVVYRTGSYWAAIVVGARSRAVDRRSLPVTSSGRMTSHTHGVIVTIGRLTCSSGWRRLLRGPVLSVVPAAFLVRGLKKSAGHRSRVRVTHRRRRIGARATLALAWLPVHLGRAADAGGAFNATIAHCPSSGGSGDHTWAGPLAGLLGSLSGVLVSPSTFLYPTGHGHHLVFASPRRL